MMSKPFLGVMAISDATIPVQAAEPARPSEDMLALAIGLGVFALALVSLFGADALGWLATTSVWTDPTSALATASKAYAGLGGVGALVLTYLALAAVLSAAAYALGDDVKRFAIRFTVAFAIAYGAWFLGLVGLFRRRHPGRSGQVRRLVVAETDQRGRLSSSRSSPASSSPMSSRRSPSGSGARSARSSTSRSPSSSSAPSSPSPWRASSRLRRR